MAALLILSAARVMSAGVISYVGDLKTDATVTGCGPSCTLSPSDSDATWAQFAAVVETFTVATPSDMFAVTFGYGGGVNGSAATILPGGLEPYLSLFDASGDFLASTYYGTYCPAGANTYNGQCDDVLLDGGVLAPGTYQIALSAFENMSYAENLGTGTLADGFTGLGNLNGNETLAYAFDVDLDPLSGVPEPGSAVLVLAALAMLPFVKRFRAARPRG
jgi:hypothetical protein